MGGRRDHGGEVTGAWVGRRTLDIDGVGIGLGLAGFQVDDWGGRGQSRESKDEETHVD